MSAIKTKSFDRKGRDCAMYVPTKVPTSSSRHATAAEAYKEELVTATTLLRKLAKKYQAHELQQSQDPTNWGYVGDLQHLNSVLRDLLGEAE